MAFCELTAPALDNERVSRAQNDFFLLKHTRSFRFWELFHYPVHLCLSRLHKFKLDHKFINSFKASLIILFPDIEIIIIKDLGTTQQVINELPVAKFQEEF